MDVSVVSASPIAAELVRYCCTTAMLIPAASTSVGHVHMLPYYSVVQTPGYHKCLPLKRWRCCFILVTTFCAVWPRHGLHVSTPNLCSCRSRYIQGLVTVSAPFGGTTDQAIAVRMGSVDFNINDWVKMPMAKAAEEVKEKHSAEVSVAAASLEQDVAAASAELMQPVAMDGDQTVQVPAMSRAASAKAKASKAAVATATFFNIDKLISNYISSLFYKATIGLPGLSMLLPYASAYGANRRIIVTARETYTAAMMRDLMKAIGDTVTDEAWKQVHELDALLAKGRVPGIPTHCLYGESCCYVQASILLPMLWSSVLQQAVWHAAVTWKAQQRTFLASLEAA